MTNVTRDDWDDKRSLEKTRDGKGCLGMTGMTRDDWHDREY